MTAKASIQSPTQARAFPDAEATKYLKKALQGALTESQVLSGAWEPELDSLQCVGVVLTLERIVGFKLAPEELVKRGGYRSVDEGVADILQRLREVWNQRLQAGGAT